MYRLKLGLRLVLSDKKQAKSGLSAMLTLPALVSRPRCRGKLKISAFRQNSLMRRSFTKSPEGIYQDGTRPHTLIN
jgi:hypothetical protein